MTQVEYEFGELRLLPAVREFWHADRRLTVPRLVFDCLTYLIEHRDRAVGRDELSSAVWGRVDIPEARVSELVLRARRVIGDDGQVQRMIRTVSGFGYRWVAVTRSTQVETDADGNQEPLRAPVYPAPDDENRERVDVTAELLSPVDAESPEVALPMEAASSRLRSRWILMALAAFAVIALAVMIHLAAKHMAHPETYATTESVRMAMVLPVAVDAPRESAWVRLGAMNLITNRLLDAGLPVLPSESVLIALGSLRPDGVQMAEDYLPTDMSQLEQRFDADPIIEGRAIRSSSSWTVVLTMRRAGNSRHIVRSEHSDVITAARQSADQLIAALGRPVPPGADSVASIDVVEERLQQAQAALLAGQMDHARAVLDQLSTRDRDDPRVIFQQAQLDFQAGHLDVAIDTYTGLLERIKDADRLLYGRVLAARAATHFRRRAFEQAVDDYDEAVVVLRDLENSSELGRALSGRGGARIPLAQFDAAASDLGQARIQLQQVGDRLGLAQVAVYFGLIESERGRFDLALPHLNEAVSTFEMFGATERTLSSLLAVLDAQAQLLRWSDALATSNRQWTMRDGANDPIFGLLMAGRRGRVLLALGRYGEAGQLLLETRSRYAGVRAGVKRYLHDFETEYAWHMGLYDDAVSAANEALSTWPDNPAYDRYGYIVLLRQRALIASGRVTTDQVERFLPVGELDNLSPIMEVARAEWAGEQGRNDEAIGYFDAALNNAQRLGMPAVIALVAESYADWLLAHDRVDEASALAGQVFGWADADFECALLQLRVFHRLGRRDPWERALKQAQELAGERQIPERLLVPPTG